MSENPIDRLPPGPDRLPLDWMVLLERKSFTCLEGAFLDWIAEEYKSAKQSGDIIALARLEPLYFVALTQDTIKFGDLSGENQAVFDEWCALPNRKHFGRPIPIILISMVSPEAYAKRKEIYETDIRNGAEVIGYGEAAYIKAKQIQELETGLRREGLIL